MRDWAPEHVQQGSKIAWLDDDHAISWIVNAGEIDPVGGVLFHRKDPPENGFTFCASAFYWAQPKGYRDQVTLWNRISVDPLTLAPSLLCGCGMHGFIQGGKWVNA